MKFTNKFFLSVSLALFSCLSMAQSSEVKVFDAGIEPTNIIWLSMGNINQTPKTIKLSTVSEVAYNRLEFSELSELQSLQVKINYIDKSNSSQIRNDAKVQNQNFEVRKV